MPKPPLDLPNARILVTNDDGVHASGIQVLEAIARQLSSDVWVCAPETEQSAASHSLTIHRPLRIREYDERRFSVDGTPTDAVLLAVKRLLGDRRPDLVLSGINHGSNIGDDVTYSGTIAAAMEATLLGVPAVALSQRINYPHPIDWAAAEHWGPEVIRKAVAIRWADNVLVNVNFPASAPGEIKGVRIVGHGKRKIGDQLIERTDPRGRPYYWIGVLRGQDPVADDTDIAAIEAGAIAVTPLCMDLTHRPTLEMLEGAFS
jgi:5'-nucleotidase